MLHGFCFSQGKNRRGNFFLWWFLTNRRTVCLRMAFFYSFEPLQTVALWTQTPQTKRNNCIHFPWIWTKQMDHRSESTLRYFIKWMKLWWVLLFDISQTRLIETPHSHYFLAFAWLSLSARLHMSVSQADGSTVGKDMVPAIDCK